jgi:16S rRNA (adenine1518-N6/adenine1519-N6)-dimethyltransferase
MIYDSPKEIALFLNERRLSLKKRFGQNFLVSPGVRRKLISVLAPAIEQTVWEVGAGIGAMTHMLAGVVERLVVFEIDRGLVHVLEESFGEDSRLIIVAGDYCKTWEGVSQAFGFPDKIIGNLPYNLAATIIATLIGWERSVTKAVFTVQKEVAKRMAAVPGSKDYSGFSLMCQSVFDVRLHGDIAAPSFYPVPEVTSTIVSLTPNDFDRDYDRALYSIVVRDLFAARRKTIRNNLVAGNIGRRYGTEAIDGALHSTRIDPHARGEELFVRQIRDLVGFFSAQDSNGSR